MKIVIIGAGPAGVSAAETIRTYDHEVTLDMLSAEPYPPYSPPAMADHFMHGTNAHYWRGEDWHERQGVNYHPGTEVTKIHPQRHLLSLANGESMEFDRAVIATGSRLYAPLEGVDLPGVYNFKFLSAAESLVSRVRSGEVKSVIIVGAGFIGMEIALLLRALGVSVIQVEMLNQVMSRMLDSHSAEVAAGIMRERGIDLRLNTRAVGFSQQGEGMAVDLESGGALTADLAIAATGVKPNLEFLVDSDIQHQWGISVDDHLRTNYANIYAAGDVIESPYRLTGETFVHAIFPNAVEQGKVVGMNLAGQDVVYQGADRMNSLKHLGLPIMAVGAAKGDEVLKVTQDGSWRTIYLNEGRIVGFQLVGDVHPAGVLRTLLNRGQRVEGFKDKLTDPSFGQGSLAWMSISGSILD
jgi:nitrite reductase (NADH) large subunit